MLDSLPRRLMDEAALRRTVDRMAHEIVERNGGTGNLALVGVLRKGDYLARRLCEAIARIDGGTVPVGSLDITLYRDDLSRSNPTPTLRRTEIPFDITGRVLVLVDDVLYTGRTTRAALDALMDYGRPKAIRYAVLVDRGHRELPIQPDFVGLALETRPQERVKVHMREDAGKDEVWLMEAPVDWVPGED